jgi:F0F1-type ATP synthase delta subunit
MKTPRAQLARIIAARTVKTGTSKQLAKAVAAYMLDENRTGELASLVRDVQADWAREGYVEVIAASAHELSPQVMKDIETEARKIYPAAKTIRITPQLQPDLVGGVALTIIDRRLDLTTKAKLQQFKMLAINGKE